MIDPASTRTATASADSAGDHASDRLTRFLLPQAGVRGVHVHLDATWAQIRARATDFHRAAPAAVTELLGEAAVAAALFTGHAKVEGRLSVQLRGDGPLRTLFAECTVAGTLRGIAQVAGDAALPRDLRLLGAGAVLAITIENPAVDGREPVRYQGLVALEADSLAGAFEDYFRQSEQLPTRLLLAADDRRAAGLMLQKLPGDSGDEDGWTRAGALFDTLTTGELLGCPAATLLRRLFHEDGVEVLGERPLRFACSCSHERVVAMLQALGETEARAAAAAGPAEIRCEFCGQQYRFSLEEVAALFPAQAVTAAAPERLQ
ncbi:Hsp33 family molecular chaperone HslO [Cognatiluteimonas weifangensis]|uniref:Hsp33 family molecular chaperone HslO n=1 Tax=Cognatiluteimonas weifangensis TaxID=2303539 RepID=A0A372DSP1_9GAMM|nr:Hsp33 family molecular chaperone HslO [Luteimonas weifangensis]RFP62504.1 Hsp33 family molecular chaperone HslO [Luteimonas weifangensis]